MDSEEKFRATVAKHGETLSDMLADLIELSERTGIPVGTYKPRSFETKWGVTDDSDGVDVDVVLEICPVDEEYEHER